MNSIIPVTSRVKINEYMHMHHCIMYYAPPLVTTQFTASNCDNSVLTIDLYIFGII